MSFETQNDLDLMLARRAFPVAQEAFDGSSLRVAAESAEIRWHATQAHPETGSVALVREDGEFVDLVGEIVKITRSRAVETREVFAYVLGTAPILGDLSLARRPFMGLGILANEFLTCRVEVVA